MWLRTYTLIHFMLLENKKSGEDFMIPSFLYILLHRVEGANKSRRIITPPEFVESSCKNNVEIWPEFSCCEHCIMSTNKKRRLETYEVCLSRLQELEYLLHISGYFHFGIPEYSRGHRLRFCVNNNQLMLLTLVCDWMSCLFFFLLRVLENVFI
jgi:hypothetical protein